MGLRGEGIFCCLSGAARVRIRGGLEHPLPSPLSRAASLPVVAVPAASFRSCLLLQAAASPPQVIAATNRVDILDPALLRSGRLDRKIEFPMPNEEARARIMQIHSRKMNVRWVKSRARR